MNDADMLDSLRIASPCPARWKDMQGDERIRFCGSCQKHVYNFCGMNPAQVAAIIREKEGRLCGRIYRRKDGTLLVGDCPVGARQVWGKMRRLAMAAAAVVLSGALVAVSPRPANGRPATRSRNQLYLAWDDAMESIKGWLGMRRPVVVLGDICVPPPTNSSPNSTSAPR